MGTICWKTILMKYHTLFFFPKIKKDVSKLSSAAVVIGALRVKIKRQKNNNTELKFEYITILMNN